ncbi:MAG: Serine--tRNA ligase [Syntrophomonadaceae bacterium]|nr:Serine--tRNA ligase [Bacillota bacterium]
MLDINFIRQNPEQVKKGVAAKNVNPQLVDDFLVLDNEWRELVKEIDDLRAKQNKLSEERKINEAKELKNKIQLLEDELRQIEIKRNEILRQLPNLPFDDVPVGKNENDNIVLREVGEKPKFDFQPKDYLELAEKLDLIDIERASKVSGSRFGYIKNQAALLEFALVQFAFEKLVKYGFTPVIPPVMIKEEMMEAMGYVDSEKDKEERYFFEKDKMYFVGTSEQSVGPMHSDEIFEEKDLPKRYAAFSTCFRREAGSYGKDTKGILRVHQFDKIEMFSFCHPEKSKEEHNLLVKIEEELMQDLKLPYRLVHLCAGDISVPSAATYDIETWMPGQNQYRETHSTSNCTDFQARRLNIRYKSAISNQQSAIKFVHTLNGTAFAVGRMLIAIIENYQQKDGSILVPEVFQKYLGFEKIC